MKQANAISWLKAQQIVLTEVDAWDAEGLQADCSVVNQMINDSEYQLVHTVWDLRHLTEYPVSITVLSEATRRLFTNEKLGYVLVVTDNKVIHFLSRSVTSLFKTRYHKSSTIEDAVRFLDEYTLDGDVLDMNKAG